MSTKDIDYYFNKHDSMKRLASNLHMKWLLVLSIILSCDHVSGYYVHYPETFYIDKNSVLLYKVINWWYDCLPEDSDQLCGRLLKYQILDNAKVEYNEAEMILKLGIKGGFTGQLSIFKQ